jgi:hypothetical protein
MINHAINEFKLAGWMDEVGNYCDDKEVICVTVLYALEVYSKNTRQSKETISKMCKETLDLLKGFSDYGGDGGAGENLIKLFETLANFGVLTPLSGKDDEWITLDYFETPDPLYVNKRYPSVFKNSDGSAYNSEGKVFYTVNDKGEKTHFSNKNSYIYIEFPYMPTTEYVEIK